MSSTLQLNFQQLQIHRPAENSDKSTVMIPVSKSPIPNPTTVTKEFLLQPKISSLGVLPCRKSTEVDGLNVMMVGSSVHELPGIKSEVIRAPSERLVATDVRRPASCQAVINEKKKMPAIVGTEGTTTKPSYAQRAKPPPMPRSRLKQKRNLKLLPDHKEPSLHVLPSSPLTEERKETKSGSSFTSLQESADQTEMAKSVISIEVTDTAPSPVRSVDDMIQALRSSRQASAQKSASDRKIDEIMKQVMSHAQEWMDEDVIKSDRSDRTEQVAFSDSNLPEFKSSFIEREFSKEDALDEADIDVSDTVSTLASQISAPAGIPDVSSILARKSSHAMHADGASETSSPVMMTMPEDDDSFDREQAQRDLQLSLDVRYDDVIAVHGANPPLIEKSAALVIPKSEDYSTPRRSGVDQFSYFGGGRIHRLCLLPSIDELNVTSQELALSRHAHANPELLETGDDSKQILEKSKKTFVEPEQNFAKTSSATLTPGYLDSSKLNPLDIEGWRKIVEGAFEKRDYTLAGSCTDIGNVGAWRPLVLTVPPKMALTTAAVKALVFPNYHGTQAIEDEVEETESWIDEDELSEIVIENNEKREYNERSIYKRHHSAGNLVTLCVNRDGSKATIRSDKNSFEKFFARFSRANAEEEIEDAEMRGELVTEADAETDDVEFLPRTRSLPNVAAMATEEGSLCLVKTDYARAMSEIQHQLELVLQQQISEQDIKRDPSNVFVNPPNYEMHEEDDKQVEPLSVPLIPRPAPPPPTPATLTQHKAKMTPRVKRRSFVVISKKKSTSKKNKRLIARIRRAFDAYKPARLERSCSLSSFPVPPQAAPKPKRNPALLKGKIKRSTSVPHLFAFDWFVSRHLKYGQEIEDMREWVRDIWNTWFDELFPPSDDDRSSSSVMEEVLSDDDELKNENEIKKRPSEIIRKLFIPDKIPSSVAFLFEEIEEPEEIVASKISELTKQLDKLSPGKVVERACHLAKRGCFLRRIGEIKAASDDLNEAIALEPHLTVAFWQRHLIRLLKNQKHDALDDLNALLKIDSKNVHAFRSRADIFASLGDFTMAIVNYSQAIKLNPSNSETYYQRAKIFEKTGDMLLAMEDYSAVYRLDSSRLDALLRRALFYFSKKTWLAAIADFTQLIEREPLNASVRTYRARAYWETGNFENALKDFSAAIHFDPINSTAYYYRGALLRKVSPEQALQDLSVSLLLDNSEKNVLALLHRGVLYSETKRYSEALADFEQTLKIDGSLVCAHVNIGVIRMTIHENYWEAIRRFTAALKQDPTYTRARVCRADAYGRVHDYQAAVRDVTRAIVHRPTERHLYLRRGKYLLQLRQFKLAAFCVRHISTLDKSFVGTSATQQAVVQSFLGNHEEACETLERAVRSQPVPSMYILLAKALMKGKRFEEATRNLHHALELTAIYANGDSPKSKDHLSDETKIHYLLGQCSTEMGNHEGALSSYNHAIKENSHYAEAYYHRGLCKLKLEVGSGIQDLNRALALNPDLFEAYLSRAAYYSTKKRFSKAILNCNEALRLRPLSVRALLCRGALKFFISAHHHAINDLTSAIELDKRCELAYYNRAVCLHATKRYQEALKDYSVVLVMGGNSDSEAGISLRARVLVNRALLYLRSEVKDPQNAALDLEEAAVLRPNDTAILHTMAMCYHRMQDLSSAHSSYTRCLKVEPAFLAAYVGRGDAHGDAGDFDTAMCEYERALKLDPSYNDARVHLGYTLHMCGHLQQAWTQFTFVLQNAPDCLSALEGRAITCLHAGNLAAAARDVSSAMNCAPPSARLLTLGGVIHQSQNDVHTAMAHYNKARDLDPLYSPAHFNAAVLYIRDRRFSAALECLQVVVRMNPNDSAALLNRAIVRVFLNETQSALADFNFASKLDPHNSHIYFNRGNLHFMLEDYQNALNDFTLAFDINPSDYVTLKRRADTKGRLGRKKEAVEDYKQSLILLEHHERLRRN